MSTSSAPPAAQLSFLPTPALDQLLCGITAGTVSTLTMQPLDLLKVQLQVETKADAAARNQTGKGAGGIWNSLRQMKHQGGWAAYYRGLSPNLLGNAASWGLYFYWSVTPDNSEAPFRLRLGRPLDRGSA